jgi:hypothetical protein
MDHLTNKVMKYFFFLSLAPQPSLGLGLLHQFQLNFLEASQQFSFLQGRVVGPMTNTHPGGPGPEAGWLPTLVASYDTHELQWDYSYSLVTTWGNEIFQ